jgi:hypothetical protein
LKNVNDKLTKCILGDKQLDGYQKKKYVCKLLFIFLLGHDIDFGHMEAVNLLSSNKYTEKQIVSDIRIYTVQCGIKKGAFQIRNNEICFSIKFRNLFWHSTQ